MLICGLYSFRNPLRKRLKFLNIMWVFNDLKYNEYLFPVKNTIIAVSIELEVLNESIKS